MHFVLLAAFIVCGDLVAADQQAQRLGRVGDLDARDPPPSADRGGPRAPACRRSATCRRRRRPAACGPGRRSPPANCSSLPRSGPLIVNWISAFWLPPPPIVATGRTPVRRLADANCGTTLARTSSMTANWSRCALLQRLQPDVDRARVLRLRRVVGDRDQRVVDLRQRANPASRCGWRSARSSRCSCPPARAGRPRTPTGRRWAGSSCWRP